MHLLTDAGEDEDERTEENGIRGKMRSLYRLRGDNMWIVFLEESGEEKEFSTKKEAERFVKEVKDFDRRNGIDDETYTIYEE